MCGSHSIVELGDGLRELVPVIGIQRVTEGGGGDGRNVRKQARGE